MDNNLQIALIESPSFIDFFFCGCNYFEVKNKK
jgi:hypothetical protein